MEGNGQVLGAFLGLASLGDPVSPPASGRTSQEACKIAFDCMFT